MLNGFFYIDHTKVAFSALLCSLRNKIFKPVKLVYCVLRKLVFIYPYSWFVIDPHFMSRRIVSLSLGAYSEHCDRNAKTRSKSRRSDNVESNSQPREWVRWSGGRQAWFRDRHHKRGGRYSKTADLEQQSWIHSRYYRVRGWIWKFMEISVFVSEKWRR